MDINEIVYNTVWIIFYVIFLFFFVATILYALSTYKRKKVEKHPPITR